MSMGFFRQENSSGLPFPSIGDLCNPGIKPVFSALQADSLPAEPLGKPPSLSKELQIFFFYFPTSASSPGYREGHLCLLVKMQII